MYFEHCSKDYHLSDILCVNDVNRNVPVGEIWYPLYYYMDQLNDDVEKRGEYLSSLK